MRVGGRSCGVFATGARPAECSIVSILAPESSLRERLTRRATNHEKRIFLVEPGNAPQTRAIDLRNVCLQHEPLMMSRVSADRLACDGVGVDMQNDIAADGSRGEAEASGACEQVNGW